MVLQVYGPAVLIILASVLVGQAICVATGDARAWWAAPAVGFAALIVITGAAIKLPGRAATAAAVAGLIVVLSALFLWRRRVLPLRPGETFVFGVPLVVTSLPFIASGRVGLPGVSLDNDTANFLLYTEALRSSRMAALWGAQNGYPLGPHSLAASLATATGLPLDVMFAALLVSVVPITALIAAGFLATQALWRKVLIGLSASLTYLVAAYYAEGAFKETIMAVLLLAFVLHGEQVQARWANADATSRLRLVLPGGLLVAAAFYTYSYPGLVWFAACGGVWIVAEVVQRPALVRSWMSVRRLSNAAPWLAGAAILAVIVLLPVAGQAISFFKSVGLSPTGAIPANVLGNLIGPLSPNEMLGIWWSPDFRKDPTNLFHAGELSALALAVLIFGLVWSIRKRKLLLPATATGCFIVWWLSSRTQSPYVTAKALVIGAPTVMVLGLRALLTRSDARLSIRAALLGGTILFCGAAFYSSYQVLRNEPVQAPEAGRELATFHQRVGPSAVLFLGDDDFAPWQLRDAAVTSLASNASSIGKVTARPQKPYVLGEASDFDSVDPADLDRFPYVVTSNTSYASQPPGNFHLLASTRLYELWKRTGPTVARQVLETSGAPGAVLNCRSPLGKRLRAARGRASIMPTPVTVAGPNLATGGLAAVPLPLPPGRWELSIQYYSSFDVALSAPGRQWTMPPYLGRLGPFFDVGEVTGHGVSSPITLSVEAKQPSFLTGTGDDLLTTLPVIAATRTPDAHRIVPLKRACGQYVDWYQLTQNPRRAS